MDEGVGVVGMVGMVGVGGSQGNTGKTKAKQRQHQKCAYSLRSATEKLLVPPIMPETSVRLNPSSWNSRTATLCG